MINSKISLASKLISKSQRIVVLTGAGASADSAIPTYRDKATSLWNGFFGKVGLIWFGVPIGWKLTPGLAWRAYASQFLYHIAHATPNDGHTALAQLEEMHPNVTVITTNVDGLHQRAGSKTVFELHGTVLKNRCMSCSKTFIPDILDQANNYMNVPGCESCNGYIRPDVVLFTESLPTSEFISSISAVKSLREGDVFIVIGTSLTVNPSASLPYQAYQRGIFILYL
eukprot:TRINITY_DN870_c0_g2_i3.p2 TRINITY_DN870_c0_g2~~TRINITY_DN870_c0_g2_i3.p2  ORF type:complete len:227 (+),score=14.81 TRINITY_DN870_c0_g2_i3:1-681(+)